MTGHLLAFDIPKGGKVTQKRRAVLFVSVLALLLMHHSMAFAQTTTATVSGLVTDETGAVLSGAQLTVTNTATGVKRSVNTDEAGRFVVTQLSPGPYELTATM